MSLLPTRSQQAETLQTWLDSGGETEMTAALEYALIGAAEFWLKIYGLTCSTEYHHDYPPLDTEVVQQLLQAHGG